MFVKVDKQNLLVFLLLMGYELGKYFSTYHCCCYNNWNVIFGFRETNEEKAEVFMLVKVDKKNALAFFLLTSYESAKDLSLYHFSCSNN